MISGSELVRRHVYQLKSVMALFNRSYLKNMPRLASKSDFEINFNLHLKCSCNQNIPNIITWGQSTNANIEEFACISMESSMEGLFSGVPPQYDWPLKGCRCIFHSELYDPILIKTSGMQPGCATLLQKAEISLTRSVRAQLVNTPSKGQIY